MKSIFGSIPASKSPVRLALNTIFVATLTSVLALSTLVAIGMLSGQLLMIPPMAASMALVAGAPNLPLAQPRNVVCGQLISASVGILTGVVGHSMWVGAIAGGLALGAMLLTRTSHSPAAATAVVGAMATEGHVNYIFCAGIAAAILVLFGLARARITKMSYPEYWW